VDDGLLADPDIATKDHGIGAQAFDADIQRQYRVVGNGPMHGNVAHQTNQHLRRRGVVLAQAEQRDAGLPERLDRQ
jgi:hypothetical protein